MGPEDEAQLLHEAFVAVIRPENPGRFGGASQGYRGWHDGSRGVQWNVGIDRDGTSPYLGVNLEGMKYDDWPIARLILREIERTELPEAMARLRRPEEIEVWWWRDAWQASARPRIAERLIKPTPFTLGSRSAGEDWRLALQEARGCLDAGRGYRGRARQMVTLPSGERREMEVSPHVQFRLRPWRYASIDRNERIEAMQAARDRLRPIYDFVKRRCA